MVLPQLQRMHGQRRLRWLGVLNGLLASLALPGLAQQLPGPVLPRFDGHPRLPGLRGRPLQPIRTVEFSDLGQLQQLNLQAMPGGGKLRLSPLSLRNHQAINLAATLKANPRLGTVLAEQGRLVELPEGIVLQSAIRFRLNPAACGAGQERQQLRSLGVSCFRPSQRPAEQLFGSRTSLRYIADPARRARAIAEYNQRSAQAREGFNARIRQARLSLQQPGLSARGIPVQQLGGASDAELTNSLLNRSVVTSQDNIFVPRDQTLSVQLLQNLSRAARGQRAAVATQHQTLGSRTLLLEDSLFLTGFTFGKDFEWSKRVSVSIDWCWVGCTETYYLEPYARFGYGLGLRMPLRATGITYRFDPGRDRDQATLSLRLEGINGSLEQYRELFDLPSSHGADSYPLFEGKELVAQLKAQAGVRMDLPIYGYDDLRVVDIQADLTDQLSGTLRHGQWTPPTPGQPAREGALWLDSLDLLGGQGNIGIAGARLTPGIRLSLETTALQLLLTDTSPGGGTQLLKGGREIALPLKVANNQSRFSLSDPEYSLTFQITPGIKAVAWIDLVAWEDEWEWPIWFPEYAITIPGDGLRFGCHEGTPCRRDGVIDVASGETQQQSGAVQPTTDRGLTARPQAGEQWGHWGRWGAWGRCPEGHYLYAFRQKVEAPQRDGDDTALNGLDFACSQEGLNWGRGSRRQWPPDALDSDRRIHHLELEAGRWGQWSEWVICPDHTFITGFRLKQEASQGGGDDSAANGFQAYCSGQAQARGVWLGARNDGPWGRWSPPVTTRPGYALNAVRLRIETAQGSGDDTGLNNVEFEAGAISPPPAPRR